MPAALEPMIGEMQNEAGITRRVLDRVPDDKLAWRPHPKSMTIGQLANHIAMVPGGITRLAQLSEFDVRNANFNPPQPASMSEVKATLEDGVKTATEYLSSVSDGDAMATWRMLADGKEIGAMPRTAMLRSIMFNHWYHHRGQLSVYLRLLDIPVPVIYGRSADETPFD